MVTDRANNTIAIKCEPLYGPSISHVHLTVAHPKCQGSGAYINCEYLLMVPDRPNVTIVINLDSNICYQMVMFTVIDI